MSYRCWPLAGATLAAMLAIAPALQAGQLAEADSFVPPFAYTDLRPVTTPDRPVVFKVLPEYRRYDPASHSAAILDVIHDRQHHTGIAQFLTFQCDQHRFNISYEGHVVNAGEHRLGITKMRRLSDPRDTGFTTTQDQGPVITALEAYACSGTLPSFPATPNQPELTD